MKTVETVEMIYDEKYLKVLEDKEVLEYAEKIKQYSKDHDNQIDLDELIIPRDQLIQKLTLKIALGL